MTNGYSWDWYDYAEPSFEGTWGSRGAKRASAFSEFGFRKMIRKRNRKSITTHPPWFENLWTALLWHAAECPFSLHRELKGFLNSHLGSQFCQFPDLKNIYEIIGTSAKDFLFNNINFGKELLLVLSIFIAIFLKLCHIQFYSLDNFDEKSVNKSKCLFSDQNCI